MNELDEEFYFGLVSGIVIGFLIGAFLTVIVTGY